jgi:o-succinylbenzoate---CoA ligase
MVVAAWLPRAAAAWPRRTALETPEESITYGDLCRRAEAVARRLAGQGVGPGDRVALALPGGVGFAEALHGCWLLGAVAAPVDVRLSERERAGQLAGAAVVVEGPLEGAERAGVELAAGHHVEAVAAVVHTSGSAGAPKPVELTYGNWLWSALGSAVALGLDPAERWLCALPVAHVGGLSILVRSAIYGTTAIVHPRFEADRAAAALAGASVTSLVPAMLARLLEAGWPGPGSLRCALVGGGPVPAALLERASAAGVPLAQTYGLTEACSQVTTSDIGDPTTAGRPLFCTRVDIGERGEILVRGPTVAPAAGPVLHTGDLGELDAAGRLAVRGRASELIVSGGENVSPVEVEAVLEAHPAVAEAAVHGRPDPQWGEAVVATVVLRDGRHADEADLRAHCRAALAGFKVPKAIAFARSLPRTAAGKLRREALTD